MRVKTRSLPVSYVLLETAIGPVFQSHPRVVRLRVT